MNFGTIYGDETTPAYVTTEGQEVWMWRKGQRVRFLTAGGDQVGPEQANVVPAICYAAYMGWIDPTAPNLSLATTREVRANTTIHS